MQSNSEISFPWKPSQSPVIAAAKYKSSPEDFIVEEELSFELSGDGEHEFLWVEKRNANTQWVIKHIAQWLGVRERDIGHAGLKDKHGVTRQWLSVYLPGKALPETLLTHDDFAILKNVRHNKKLKIGSIRENRFTLILRAVKGEKEDIEQRLQKIAQTGFPNYFGEQRFGFAMNNLSKARAMLVQKRRFKKSQQSIYLSAIRSWFFNQFLASRISSEHWQRPMTGDRINLNSTRSFFVYDAEDEDLSGRLLAGDVHVAGPLPGKDIFSLQPPLSDDLLKTWEEYADCLEFLPGKTDFRSLRVIPGNLSWQWMNSDDDLELSFALSSGSYATALLHELGSVEDAAPKHRNAG